MVDLSQAMALVSALKSAGEITQAMVGIRDGAKLQSKVIELNGIILSAQNSALASNIDQMRLLEQIRSLEEKLMRLEDWGAEKQRYELKEVGKGCRAYTLKTDVENAQNEHCLCANCFEDRRKSVLQQETRAPGMSRVLVCQHCGSELYTSGIRHPEHKSAGRVRRP
ncbi:hypothetical protein BH10PSE7_BH10PSE7_16550 [soil metagenome]